MSLDVNAFESMKSKEFLPFMKSPYVKKYLSDIILTNEEDFENKLYRLKRDLNKIPEEELDSIVKAMQFYSRWAQILYKQRKLYTGHDRTILLRASKSFSELANDIERGRVT